MESATVPEGFVFDLEDIGMYLEPVFELFSETKSPTVQKVNHYLKIISSYARLYYYLQNVYDKTVAEGTFSSEPEVRVSIYETEMARREMQTELSKGKKKCSHAKLCEIKVGLIRLITIISTDYERARKTCLYTTSLSRVARTDRIYRIYDAEMVHFEDEPDTVVHIKETIEKALKNVFIDPPIN